MKYGICKTVLKKKKILKILNFRMHTLFENCYETITFNVGRVGTFRTRVYGWATTGGGGGVSKSMSLPRSPYTKKDNTLSLLVCSDIYLELSVLCLPLLLKEDVCHYR